jgi:hypothetical protein
MKRRKKARRLPKRAPFFMEGRISDNLTVSSTLAGYHMACAAWHDGQAAGYEFRALETDHSPDHDTWEALSCALLAITHLRLANAARAKAREAAARWSEPATFHIVTPSAAPQEAA